MPFTIQISSHSESPNFVSVGLFWVVSKMETVAR